MVILVSLATAALFGSGDFCGGLATRKASVVQVVAGSHLVGLVGVVAVSLISGAPLQLTDLGLGAMGGVFGGLGVALLYRRLAAGPMYVVAPLTAITSAVVPAAHGAVIGERLAAMAWLGVGVGLVAIGLVSSSPPIRGDETPVTLQVVAESLLAGAGFGMLFIMLDATDPAAAPWPVVGARMATGLGLTMILAARSLGGVASPFPPERRTGLLIAVTGVFDTLANMGFLYATGRGALAVVAILSSLYPIATVVLARLVLDERMTRIQRFGFGFAVAATGLIASG
jgi:uncharacterized membrane protein